MLKEALHQKFKDITDTVGQYPVELEFKDKHCTIKRRVVNANSGID